MRRILLLMVAVSLAMTVAAMAQIRFNRGQRAAARQPGTTVSPATATAPAGPTLADADRTSDEQAIRQVIELVARYYDAGNAKALAGLFTADAELVDEAGQTVRGRQAIEQSFAPCLPPIPRPA